MKRLRAATVALIGAAAVTGGGTALAAEPGNSQAAHDCLDGPQRDLYLVDGQREVQADVDYGSLMHGLDGGLAYVETDSHGACVSFFAQARKGRTSGGKVVPHDISIVRVIDKSSPS
jgi:hypothetical protein